MFLSTVDTIQFGSNILKLKLIRCQITLIFPVKSYIPKRIPLQFVLTYHPWRILASTTINITADGLAMQGESTKQNLQVFRMEGF